MIRREGLDAEVGGSHERDLAVTGDEKRDERDRKHARKGEFEQRGNPDGRHPELASRIGPELRKERQRERARQRSEAHRPEQEAKSARAHVQNLFGEQRHQGEPVHREQREDGDRDQQHPDDRLVSRVREALRDAGGDWQPVRLGDVHRQVAHEKQCPNSCEIAE